VKNNLEGYEFISRNFDRMGVKYAPSQANFVFFETGKNSAEVYESLLKNGIITRPMAGWGNPNALRVTIGTLEECQKFISVLEKIL
jgi:histidinol-phosphate aminotransferase